jgi:23S rRNA-/tRNA-specific pseudouridylate synthase
MSSFASLLGFERRAAHRWRCAPPHCGAQIPSVPKVDNYRESVLTRLRELYPGEGLAPMNRIDVNTRGIIILGRSERFKREFGHLLQVRLW